MLYILSVSPYKCDFPALLNLVTSADAILLVQDGVTAGVQDGDNLGFLLEKKAALFALNEDILARGLEGKISSYIAPIDYTEFVKLTVEHHQSMTW